jgi:hypothetical protein
LEETTIQVLFGDGTSEYFISLCFEGRADDIDNDIQHLIVNNAEVVGAYNYFLLQLLRKRGKLVK